MSYSIQSVQLAPNGVVTEIYPEEGNEAGKIDLLNDSKRGEISNYAKDHNTIITQGPVELKQGGSGLVVRNPIYLEDENGQEYFGDLRLRFCVFLKFLRIRQTLYLSLNIIIAF